MAACVPWKTGKEGCDQQYCDQAGGVHTVMPGNPGLAGLQHDCRFGLKWLDSSDRSPTMTLLFSKRGQGQRLNMSIVSRPNTRVFLGQSKTTLVNDSIQMVFPLPIGDCWSATRVDSPTTWSHRSPGARLTWPGTASWGSARAKDFLGEGKKMNSSNLQFGHFVKETCFCT